MADLRVAEEVIHGNQEEVLTWFERISRHTTKIILVISGSLYASALSAIVFSEPHPYLVAASPYLFTLANYIIGTFLFGVIIKSSEYLSVFSRILVPEIGRSLQVTGEKHKKSTEEILTTMLAKPDFVCNMPSLESYWLTLTTHEIQRRYPGFDGRKIADKVFKNHVKWDRPYLVEKVEFEYDVERQEGTEDIHITEVSKITLATDKTAVEPIYRFEWQAEEAGTLISNPEWDIFNEANKSLLNGNHAVPPENGKYCVTYPLDPGRKYYITRKINITIHPNSAPHWYCDTYSFAMSFTVRIMKATGVNVSVHYPPDLFAPDAGVGKAYKSIRPVFPGEGFHLIFR